MCATWGWNPKSRPRRPWATFPPRIDCYLVNGLCRKGAAKRRSVKMGIHLDRPPSTAHLRTMLVAMSDLPLVSQTSSVSSLKPCHVSPDVAPQHPTRRPMSQSLQGALALAPGLIAELLPDTLGLSTHQFGNYVVQHVRSAGVCCERPTGSAETVLSRMSCECSPRSVCASCRRCPSWPPRH